MPLIIDNTSAERISIPLDAPLVSETWRDSGLLASLKDLLSTNERDEAPRRSMAGEVYRDSRAACSGDDVVFATPEANLDGADSIDLVCLANRQIFDGNVEGLLRVEDFLRVEDRLKESGLLYLGAGRAPARQLFPSGSSPVAFPLAGWATHPSTLNLAANISADRTMVPLLPCVVKARLRKRGQD